MDRPVHVCPGPAAGCDPAASGSEFRYGPAGSRYLQQIRPAEAKYGPKTVYYVDKDFELWVWAPSATLPSGAVEERSYLSGSVVAYRRDAGPRELRYQSVDRLGSIELVTKDDAAASVASLDLHGYDAFGKPRGEAWTSSGDRLHPGGDLLATSDRGFTGHEHLDAHYLIHMNGRVYDYRLGRFLSVDPVISEPFNSQAINPYSYIGNNPLSGTDPTGYSAETEIIKAAVKVFVILVGNGASAADSRAGQGPVSDTASPSTIARMVSTTAGAAFGSLQAVTPGGAFTAPLSPAANDSDFEAARAAALITVGVGQVIIGGSQAIAGNAASAAGPVLSESGAGVLAIPAGQVVAAAGTALVVQGVVNTVAGVLAGKNVMEMRSSGSGGGPKEGSTGGPGAGKRFSPSTKDQAEAEANGQCVFCGRETTREAGPTQRNTDHAIPKSRDGNNTLPNAQKTCRECNQQKATKSTEEYERARKKR